MTTFSQQLQFFFKQLEQLNLSPKIKEPVQLNIPNYTNLANFFTNFKEAYEPLNQLKKTGFYVNVWKIAGLKRDEIRNNQVLKWFLDCKADHGLENTVLEILLSTLPIELKTPQKYSSYAENYPISDGKNRIDIEIESDELLIFIEIKIDANEGIDQLKRYQEIAQIKANNKCWVIIYLTKTGVLPSQYILKNKSDYANLYSLSWQDFANAILKKVIIQHTHSHNLWLLKQFAEHMITFK